ncbi:MAG: YceI family protein [Bacteroidia bacterium]|nr:YceI family protein [Bacteroidia bacterium]
MCSRALVVLGLLTVASIADAQVYLTRNGRIDFYSNAPLEIIHAYSSRLKGVLDFSKKAFVFTVKIRSFEGFNSPLQREHFNENYMESDKYPEAVFQGKMIGDFDPEANTAQIIRAKGIMQMHNMNKEIIITVELKKQGESVLANAAFTLMPKDFGIRIPKIVHEKIASEINVNVSLLLNKN